MQSIINNDERIGLLDISKRVASNYNIVACCIYGSKVAGYARRDSDYDLLLVLDNYKDLIKYVYMHDDNNNGLSASILIVDKDALIKDATKAALGEFVVGRLLHPYEPLLGYEYLKEVEYTYKRRVIIESIRELAKITPLYDEIVIPIKYFLLNKIKSRAKIYPHALYSYVKTYTNEHGQRNIASSLDGFIKALEALEREGLIKFYDKDNVIVSSKIKKEGYLLRDVSNGILAYIVHFYAGKGILNFFKKEAKSKLKRRKEIGSISQEFSRPEIILNLKDCILLHEEDWLKELLTRLNLIDCSISTKSIGDLYSTTTLYTINYKDRILELVSKHYASIKSLKWIALNLWMCGLVRFDVSPSIRQVNEYKGMVRLKRLGFKVPDVIGLSYKEKVTITKYIKGTMLDTIIKDILQNKVNSTDVITDFGKILYNIHKHGYMMRDTKPTNVIINNRDIYLIDLEQFTTLKDPTWDIVCFIYYSLKFTNNEEAVRIIVRAFLDGYTEEDRCSRYVIRNALSKKYVIPFYPAMTLNTIFTILREMRHYST